MKPDLQDKLVEILTSIQTAASKANDFAVEQLPDIAQQEEKPKPVGWISKNNVVYPLEAKDEVHPVNELRPLYTAPPQREWQGLTDDEIWNADEIMAANSECGASFETLRELVHAISDKLKEKNT